MLTMLIHGPEAPRIAAAPDVLHLLGRGFLAEHVLLDFIDLDLIDVNAPDVLGHVGLAALADVGQQGQNRILVGPGHPHGPADAHPLAQQLDNLGGLVEPDPHAGQGAGAFGPAFSAVLAAVAGGSGLGGSVCTAVLVLANSGNHGDCFPSLGAFAYDSVTSWNRAKARFSGPLKPCKASAGFLSALFVQTNK